MRQPER